uniref:Apyrase, putative n=1 Tax=Entamoeba invadens TaxID=33085 RepID=S0B4P4_ENTIV|nr:apyrase precursor, putative [Entamoeba invadens]
MRTKIYIIGFVVTFISLTTLLLFSATFYALVFNEKPAIFAKKSIKGDTFQYPETMKGYNTYSLSSTKFQVIFVSDNDKYNKGLDTYGVSKVGFGHIEFKDGQWTFTPNDAKKFEVKALYQYNKRGTEFSEIISYNGELYVFDDKTGIGHKLDTVNKKVYPRLIMADGMGNLVTGFKHEWATIKGDQLYLGSQGLDSINQDGTYGRTNKYSVQIVNTNGSYVTINFSNVYKSLETLININLPGYTNMEGVTYSNMKKKWYFAPRKVSNTFYSDDHDVISSGKYIFAMDEDFKNPTVKEDVQFNETRGFSTLKLLPFHEDLIVYIKTYENGAALQSWIGMTNADGAKMMEEVSLGNDKYEGLEIIPLDA